MQNQRMFEQKNENKIFYSNKMILQEKPRHI